MLSIDVSPDAVFDTKISTDVCPEKVIALHAAWLRREPGGSRATLWEANLRGVDFRGAELGRADLRDANLRRADLWGADLHEAILRGADLRKATLQIANLREANLREANMRGTDLGGADLREANLRAADLRGANLWGADLRDADLRGADLRDADLRRVQLAGADLTGTLLSPYLIVPTEGSFIGWMPAGDGVLKLEIPADALRTNGVGSRLCRADKAVVIGAYDGDGTPLPDGGRLQQKAQVRGTDQVDPAESGSVIERRRIGDPRADSTQGVHFYLTWEEAAEAGRIDEVLKVPDQEADHL